MRFLLVLAMILVFMPGCSKTSVEGKTSTVIVREPISELEREPVPGTVDDVWTEPMYDTVRVPGQLDPSGNYYRQGHVTVVEIRPGRYQKVEFPDVDKDVRDLDVSR